MIVEGRRREPSRAGAYVWPALFFAVLMAFAAYWVLNEAGRTRALRQEMVEGYTGRSELGQLLSDVNEAETSQRGYLLSGDESFLGNYRRDRADIPVQLSALERRYAAAPAERARLDDISRLCQLKFGEMDQTIALRQHGRAREAEAVFADGQGRQEMEAIRATVDRIRADDNRRIESDLARDRRRAMRTEQIIVVLLVCLAIGVAASIYLIRRYAEARSNLVLASRAEAARERAVFEAAMDGILILDPQGRVERANPAAERMFGRERGELAGLPAAQLFAKDAQDVLAALGREAHDGGLRREVTGARKDGSRFPLELSLADTKADDLGVLLFTRDISERRHVERLKDEFVSTVSHELRTPLTSIAGSLGLIAGGAAGQLPEKAARLISIAQSNSQRLVRLINDVLDLEKLESGKLPFQFSVLDLRDIAQRAIDGVRGYADQLGVELLLADGPAAPVRGDTDRLVQVVTNLLSNAAKYSPTGEAVRVKVEREGGNAALSVADHGPGVPEAFRDRIFARFAQADSSDRGKGGTGLGLYIAREIAERHGGRLWFESPQGGGSTFHLDLPLLEEAPVRFAPRDRVLLVEDEPAAAALLTAILEHEGLKTDNAANLREAREALTDAGRFGAIVLDLRLPDGDGMDLVKQLRSRPDTRGIPVVVVSADAARGKDPAVRTLEVIDWMEKPVDPDRLTELVRAALTASEAGGNVILHVDDDRDIREVVATALAGVGEVVSAETLAQARAFLAERKPALVIMDLELRDGSGLELLHDLKDDKVPVIIFSAQDTSGDFGRPVTAVLVKSRTSLAGLVGAVRELVEQKERAT